MFTIVGASKSLTSQKKIEAALEVIISALSDVRVRKRDLLKKELTVVFLSPVEMKRLNRQYRGKNKVTDVLSFASGRESDELLGELVLCPKEIQKRGRSHGLSYEQELGYNMIHGILHLLGYDHEVSKKEEVIMFKIQDRIFDQLY